MLEKKFVLKKNQYLAHLNLQIEANQFTFLVAPTGIGKTTLTMEDSVTNLNWLSSWFPPKIKFPSYNRSMALLIQNIYFFMVTRAQMKIFVVSKVSSSRLMISLKKS